MALTPAHRLLNSIGYRALDTDFAAWMDLGLATPGIGTDGETDLACLLDNPGHLTLSSSTYAPVLAMAQRLFAAGSDPFHEGRRHRSALALAFIRGLTPLAADFLVQGDRPAPEVLARLTVTRDLQRKPGLPRPVGLVAGLARLGRPEALQMVLDAGVPATTEALGWAFSGTLSVLLQAGAEPDATTYAQWQARLKAKDLTLDDVTLLRKTMTAAGWTVPGPSVEEVHRVAFTEAMLEGSLTKMEGLLPHLPVGSTLEINNAAGKSAQVPLVEALGLTVLRHAGKTVAQYVALFFCAHLDAVLGPSAQAPDEHWGWAVLLGSADAHNQARVLAWAEGDGERLWQAADRLTHRLLDEKVGQGVLAKRHLASLWTGAFGAEVIAAGQGMPYPPSHATHDQQVRRWLGPLAPELWASLGPDAWSQPTDPVRVQIEESDALRKWLPTSPTLRWAFLLRGLAIHVEKSQKSRSLNYVQLTAQAKREMEHPQVVDLAHPDLAAAIAALEQAHPPTATLYLSALHAHNQAQAILTTASSAPSRPGMRRS
jgi:hypothetical protein